MHKVKRSWSNHPKCNKTIMLQKKLQAAIENDRKRIRIDRITSSSRNTTFPKLSTRAEEIGIVGSMSHPSTTKPKLIISSALTLINKKDSIRKSWCCKVVKKESSSKLIIKDNPCFLRVWVKRWFLKKSTGIHILIRCTARTMRKFTTTLKNTLTNLSCIPKKDIMERCHYSQWRFIQSSLLRIP